MQDWNIAEQKLTGLLDLKRRPVAITLHDSVPGNSALFTGSVPAGCSFWSLAASGKVLHTVPEDHHNCPIGSYTHSLELPAEKIDQLNETLSLMNEIGYLRPEEVPGIARLTQSPKSVSYMPLGDVSEMPDVVILTMRPSRLMLLQEAVLRSGGSPQTPLLGRPTCMAIPLSIATGLVVSNGCIGNRVYTEIGEDEQYAMFPGRVLEQVVTELDTIVSANASLLNYHTKRRHELTVAV